MDIELNDEWKTFRVTITPTTTSSLQHRCNHSIYTNVDFYQTTVCHINNVIFADLNTVQKCPDLLGFSRFIRAENTPTKYSIWTVETHCYALKCCISSLYGIVLNYVVLSIKTALSCWSHFGFHQGDIIIITGTIKRKYIMVEIARKFCTLQVWLLKVRLGIDGPKWFWFSPKLFTLLVDQCDRCDWIFTRTLMHVC